MARRRYYRRSVRVVAAKKKWASNLHQGNLGGATASDSVALVTNSTQGSTPTPVIVKAGNFKIQGDVAITSANVSYGTVNVFLLYAPEGISGSSTDLNGSIQAHPEWVMAWTCVDCPDTTASSTSQVFSANKFSLSTRLKRNLNSGDRIYLFIQYSSGISAQCSYTAQWFTCAN